jgi:hypothetical protein
MFEKLFNWGKKEASNPQIIQPSIPFGRYSDNNKPKATVAKWADADNLFKEKKYTESIQAFFEYLKDATVDNVTFIQNGEEASFQFLQGSKIVRGTIQKHKIKAEVSIAKMPNPGVAIMRRLLNQNFNLSYSRYALHNDVLCMRMDSDVSAANPSKLYYGLKELATNADKQDDLLVQDFTQLETIDTEHIIDLDEKEKEVKYTFLQQWIKEVLDIVANIDFEKMQGGISYLILSLLYKIDFLIIPEGKLKRELDEIYIIYFKKDGRSTLEKSRDMLEALKKVQAKTNEEVYPYLFHSKSTFSIVAPTVYKNVAESIHKANENSIWYKDNNYPKFCNEVIAYGIGYAQYSFSIPKALTDLYLLFMQVNHADYFAALSFALPYINENKLHKEAIAEKINSIINNWKERYPKLELNTENINYTTLEDFNFSFCNELEFLNFE